MAVEVTLVFAAVPASLRVRLQADDGAKERLLSHRAVATAASARRVGTVHMVVWREHAGQPEQRRTKSERGVQAKACLQQHSLMQTQAGGTSYAMLRTWHDCRLRPACSDNFHSDDAGRDAQAAMRRPWTKCLSRRPAGEVERKTKGERSGSGSSSSSSGGSRGRRGGIPASDRDWRGGAGLKIRAVQRRPVVLVFGKTRCNATSSSTPRHAAHLLLRALHMPACHLALARLGLLQACAA